MTSIAPRHNDLTGKDRLAAERWRDRFGGHIIESDEGVWLIDYTSKGGNRLSVRFDDGHPKSLPAAPLGRMSKQPAANDNKPTGINLADWKATRFHGEPEPLEYLVSGTIPLGVPGMVAAMGGVGKSLSILELHRRVSFGTSVLSSPVFGGRVAHEGTTVMLTSEDDANELHRRLAALDPKEERLTAKGERLIVVPLPSVGGPVAFWKQDKTGLVATDDFKRVQDQLIEIPDLALVTIDPLASFAHLAINEDPMAGQFVCSSMAALASATGATVLTAHHMKKVGKAITSLDEARDAIRGSTALVDGLRLVYALWPAEDKEGRRICKSLGEPFDHGKVAFGGVVKANGPARRAMSTYVRNDFGLLVDRTAGLGAAAPDQGDLLTALVTAIEAAAADGQPYTKTGENGLFKQKTRLPGELAGLSRAKLEGLADTALERRDIVAALAKGSTTVKWLDVPTGQFGMGLGEFRKGMAR
ncbi:AAA family ATPase [Mesorhizobium sp.]|uniref:AAA family ATPase n=1 Tax=Mesorhizobium sp. TaxID=1871066 RepID=UPI000FE99A48|nr:AAA family ATPase [Mesorhizobium sp.]RWE35003.1 MAG: hypothetical protein EOS77_08500 [Mesorhizobium sp.]